MQGSQGFSLCEKCQELRISNEAFLKSAPGSLGGKFKSALFRKTMGFFEEGTPHLSPQGRAMIESNDEYYIAGVPFGSLRDLRTREGACRLCHFISASLPEDLFHDLDPSAEEKELKLLRKSSYAPTFTAMRRSSANPHARSKKSYLAIYLDHRELGIKLIPLAEDFPCPWAFGRLPADPQGAVEINKLQHWIGSCEKWHVDTYCNTFRTLKATVAGLEEGGGLFQHWHQLPRTIQDAINLTHRVGERYLWVDAICIVQDDWENKADAIANMDLVYSNATVTIVAGSGIDASAGLPGLRPGNRNLQMKAAMIQPGLRMMAVGKGLELLEKWTYSTRAWTYQEVMLSRRTLIFIDGEIIFRCRKTSWYEEVDMYDFNNDILSPPYFGSRSDMRDHSSIMGMNYPAFSTVLLAEAASTLSARQLTVPSDVLNAFRGMSNVLSRDINTTMFWGLPTAYFEHSLLWNITASSLNRREGFPSWSWTGWHGRLAWGSIEDSGFLMDGSLDTGDYCRPVYLASERPDPAVDERVKQPGLLHGRLRNAVKSSLSPHYIGAKGNAEPSFAALQLGTEKQRERLLYFWTACASFHLRREQAQNESSTPFSTNKHWKSSASLSRIPPTVAAADGTIAISSDESQRTGRQSTTRNRVFIIDRYNRNCGILTLMSAIDWPDERLSEVPDSPRFHEIVVLNGVTFGASQYHIESVNDFRDPFDLADMPPPPNRDPRPSGEWRNPGSSKQDLQDLKSDLRNNVIAPTYKVMLVETKDGIAYRAGFGAIYKSSLDDAVSVEHWTEIVLG
ncbi:MAG: hypothetical protein Q9221_003718 [Calogaya cf. arnoldii]